MSATETLDTRPSTGAGDSPSLSSSSPSSSNPLVAGREESRSAVSGSGVVEDIWGITHGLSQGSWLETGLSSLSLAADAVGVGADPLGTLIAWGAGWLIDHFGPLKSWMDQFLGDADSVRADAATWSNVAQAMGECADTLEGDEKNLMGEQVDATADAYRASNADTISALRTASGAADAMGKATSVLAEVVGLVHDLLRDAISAIVGTLASAIIEAIATCGLAIPLIIAQVQVKVGAKATQMAAHITAVLKSARTLGHNLTHLSGLLDMLRGMLTRAKNTAANAAHMFTGAKPATAAAGGATPHGPTTGTTAHTGTGTGHTAHHTPPPAPDTPTPTPDIPPTTPKPKKRHPKYSNRTTDGKYAKENGGATTYEDSEQIGEDMFKAVQERRGEPVMDVIRDKHMATVGGYDRRRCYDRVIQCHDGSYIGLEVKSGSASLNEHQRTFDALVSPANPARIVHKGETISIIGVRYQQVPRQEI
ncbi:hypothetical protein [Schaalia georgiae]|uniref:hypothetical protein n=1 Tax=Schaalia georgiae TaxID=52768 RepID=UPI001039FC16|nr:hypothetical protein [Schaalia georgiae]